MTTREAASYLGYVTLFAIVVAWGFLWHTPRQSAIDEVRELRAAKEIKAELPAHLRSDDSQLRRMTSAMLK
jgi:hypothetical protein